MAWQDLFTGGAGLIGQYLAQREGVEKQRELGQQAQAGAQALGSELMTAAQQQFKPFTVTTGLGPSLRVGQEGITFAPEPGTAEERFLQDARALARSGAQQLAAVTGPGKLQAEQERIQGMLLGDDIGTAQQDVFSQLQAMRAPEQERQRLALENRLFQQGREGLRTAMYGGSPEQLAFEKAVQEQQAADALAARQQALTERGQRAGLISQALGLGGQQQALQAELGLGGAQAAFLPQQQALSLLAGGTPFSELATRAGLQGVTTRGALELGGLEALTGAYGQAAALEQAQLNALVNSLFGGSSGDTGLFGGLLDIVTGGADKPTFDDLLNSYLGEGLSTREAAKKAADFLGL